MLSGLKFIPRDQIDKEKDEKPSTKETRKLGRRKEKTGKKRKYSDGEDPNEGGSQSESERDRKKRKGSQTLDSNNLLRKEMGLEWMLRPKDARENNSSKASLIEPEETASVEEESFQKSTKEDVTPRHPKMRVPKVDDSLCWGKRGNKNMPAAEDNALLVSSALSSSNKFLNDGSFLAQFTRKEESVCSKPEAARAEPKSATHFLTQQDRCRFCFENPSRPKHLVVAIANSTYLALPQQQPVVSGHCRILTLQHESSTRTVEDDVWDEIRNFKKCLIMMFAEQGKEVVFLETVMGLAQQRRHCMVECVPLPRRVAKQAPVFFKKAIDEAEDEWSQHNAKKLIDTTEKGLRGSIPNNFPYFHVEFGLNKGFVHVIDDEKEFKSSFGLDIIRGILHLPAEDMHRRPRQDSFEAQKQAVLNFARDWEPVDWTKQLG